MKNSTTSIYFHQQDTLFVLKHKKRIRSWIDSVIKAEKFELGEINYIFCSDEYLYKMNVEFLSHNTYTDVITFDHSHDEFMILGDIFISIDRVKDNAKQIGTSFYNELRRVMIHGVLHLCLYNDTSLEEKSQMREKEDEYLSLFEKNL